MITKITGTLNLILNDRVRLQVGPFEYEVLISDMSRQQLESQIGQAITLHTTHYLEAGSQQSKMVPRLIGFLHESELEFFDLFCTVDKIGAKRALKALARPVRSIAEAIQAQDEAFLSKLPGIGATTAEKIIATLRKKVVKFALSRWGDGTPTSEPSTVASQLHQEVVQSLIALGHPAVEARQMLDRVLASGKSFATAEDIFLALYQQSH